VTTTERATLAVALPLAILAGLLLGRFLFVAACRTQLCRTRTRHSLLGGKQLEETATPEVSSDDHE